MYGQRGDDFLDGGTGVDLIDDTEGDNTHLALWGTGIVPDSSYYAVTVDRTDDDDELGSLRWSLGFAEAVDPTMLAVVDFQIPDDDPRYIDVDETIGGDTDPDAFLLQTTDALPPLLSGNVVINGLSQGGYAEQVLSAGEEPNPSGPEIILDGSYILNNGIDIRSDGNGVFGLDIRQFLQHGILIRGNENRIDSNFIGTDPTGTMDLGNNGIGVFVLNASFNRIEHNLVSGNQINGIVIGGPAAGGNTIADNMIGTDVSGTAALGNTLGVHLGDAPGNVVEHNLISGNLVGIDISGLAAVGNTVRDNRIGTTADGLTPLGNRADGIFIDGAPGNTLSENVITASGFNGILVSGAAPPATRFSEMRFMPTGVSASILAAAVSP